MMGLVVEVGSMLLGRVLVWCLWLLSLDVRGIQCEKKECNVDVFGGPGY